jgi:heptosyltransferase-2
VHQAFYYLGILSGAGWLDRRPWEGSEYPLSISLRIRDSDRISAREILRACGVRPDEIVIGINPGAFYGEAKRWLSGHYAAVADALVEQYQARIVLFGSSADRPVAEAVAESMKRSPVILAGRTTLGELMGLIRECSLLITNDSGPMHLAAALDVPQVAIFGSTSETLTGPLSGEATVLKHPVGCNPCFLRKCPTDFRCMTGISAAQVLEAVRRRLDAQNRGRT